MRSMLDEPRAFRIQPARLSVRFTPRAVLAVVAMIVVGTVVGVWTLSTGRAGIPASEVIEALLGGGSDRNRMIVVDWRLPRLLLAVLLGGALGVSGAVFQSLSRNPLGSPDIIGFTTGAATGALFVILVRSGSGTDVAVGAVIGGFVSAVLVYALAYRRGLATYRLVLVGVALSAMFVSVNEWLILQAELDDAAMAHVWQLGNLNSLGWTEVHIVSITLAVLVPAAIWLNRPMQMMEMGDDTARSLGIPVERMRIGLILVGIGLVAVATAIAGPIAFVALAAPQLAHRLTRTPGLSVGPAAAMGAVLLVVSDAVAQRFTETQMPVGVITVSIGGIYLVWLLFSEKRRST